MNFSTTRTTRATRNLAFTATLLLAFALSTATTASASSLSCTISGSSWGAPVNGSTSVTCNDGISFAGFSVTNPEGGASGKIDLVSAGPCPLYVGGGVCLLFDPNMGVQPTPQDEDLSYTATGSVMAIDMGVGGTDATVGETACTTPFVNGVCTPGTILGQITLASGSGDQFLWKGIEPVPTAYLFKDIDVQAGGALSAELTESFAVCKPPETPEPMSLVLLGPGLLVLGLIRRRAKLKSCF